MIFGGLSETDIPHSEQRHSDEQLLTAYLCVVWWLMIGQAPRVVCLPFSPHKAVIIHRGATNLWPDSIFILLCVFF